MPTTPTRTMCSRNMVETSEIMDSSVASSPALTRRTHLPCSSIRIEVSPALQAGELIGGSTDPALTKRGIPVLATHTSDATHNVEPSEELRGMKDRTKDSSQQALNLQRASLKPYKSTCVDQPCSLPRKEMAEIKLELELELELAQKELEAAEVRLQLARAAMLASESEDEDYYSYERTQEIADQPIQPSEELDEFKRNMKSNILELSTAIKSNNKDDVEPGDIKKPRNMIAPPACSLEWKETVKRNFRTAQNLPSQKQRSTHCVCVQKEITGNTKTKMNICVLCKEDHRLIVCQKYREANVDERWNIVKQTRLCFRCIRFRHRRTECTGPPCMKCGNSSHHISLCRTSEKLEKYFVATRDKENSSVSTSYKAKYNVQSPENKREMISARNDDGKIYLKIIPVDLYGPKGKIRVLALLDEGSTVTLLDSSVAEKIGANGKKESLTITAIDGSRIKTNNSRRLKLEIKGAHREFRDEIEVRTIEDLKVMEQGVDTKVLKDHPHLSDIRKELIYSAERPKLLIGQDNWGFIFTKKIKEGKTSNLVASLTKLGWVLHGCDKKSNTTVNFISHVEVKEEKKSKEMFRQQKNLKTESCGFHAVLSRDKRRPLEVLKKRVEKTPDERHATKLLKVKQEDALTYDQTRQTKKPSCRTDSNCNLQRGKSNSRNIKKFVAPCLSENKEIIKQSHERNLRTRVLGWGLVRKNRLMTPQGRYLTTPTEVRHGSEIQFAQERRRMHGL